MKKVGAARQGLNTGQNHAVEELQQTRGRCPVSSIMIQLPPELKGLFDALSTLATRKVQPCGAEVSSSHARTEMWVV
jgi:hypothetical protein